MANDESHSKKHHRRIVKMMENMMVTASRLEMEGDHPNEEEKENGIRLLNLII